jgi:DNA-binding transcriptional regulator YiaG
MRALADQRSLAAASAFQGDGAVVRAAREAARLSQADFGGRLGMSRDQVRRLERGGPVSAAMGEAIAEVLLARPQSDIRARERRERAVETVAAIARAVGGVTPDELKHELRRRRWTDRSLARGLEAEEAIRVALDRGCVQEAERTHRDRFGRPSRQLVLVADAPHAPTVRTGPRPWGETPSKLDGAELRRWLERTRLQRLGQRLEPPVTAAAVAQWKRKGVPTGRLEEVWALLRHAAACDLRRRRREARLSLRELGDAVGMSKPTVWGWEQGKLWPSEVHWERVYAALECAMAQPREVEMTVEELNRLLTVARERGVSLSAIARQVGMNRNLLYLARDGDKALPVKWWAPLRTALEAAARRQPPDRLRDEIVPAVAELVERRGWILRSEVPEHLGVYRSLVERGVRLALEQRLVHLGPRVVEYDSGAREQLVLCPGPPPRRRERRRDRAAELAAELATDVVDAVRSEPGQTRSELASVLGINVKLSRKAVSSCLGSQEIHERHVAGSARYTLSAAGRRGTVRVELWPGPRPPSQPRPSAMTPEKLQAELDRRAVTPPQLAEALGVSDWTVAVWLRAGVPATRSPQLREWLAGTPRMSDAARGREARAAIRRAVEHNEGLTVRQLTSRLPEHRQSLASALEELLTAGDVYYRPQRAPNRLGLFLGPTPPEWRPGAAVTGQELVALRERMRWSQKHLADLLGAPSAYLSGWENRPREPIPSGWWAVIHRLERLPAPVDPPTGKQLASARWRVGLETKEFAALVGTTYETVCRWEHGDRPGPRLARRLLEVLGDCERGIALSEPRKAGEKS